MFEYHIAFGALIVLFSVYPLIYHNKISSYNETKGYTEDICYGGDNITDANIIGRSDCYGTISTHTESGHIVSIFYPPLPGLKYGKKKIEDWVDKMMNVESQFICYIDYSNKIIVDDDINETYEYMGISEYYDIGYCKLAYLISLTMLFMAVLVFLIPSVMYTSVVFRRCYLKIKNRNNPYDMV